MSTNKEEIKEQVVLAGGKFSRGKKVHCFLHNDSNPSSWIAESGNGWYWTCGVCNVVMGLAALKEHNGLEVKVKKKQSFNSKEDILKLYSNIEDVYPYSDPETKNADLLIIRYRTEKGKAFTQAHQKDDKWYLGKPSGKLPLFNRERILKASTVVFVEGEKAVKLLTHLGFTASTSSGGSGNANNSNYSTLSDKEIIIWGDNDKPGRKYVEDVLTNLQDIKAKVKVVDIDSLSLGEGEDVVDFTQRVADTGGDLKSCKMAVQAVLDAAHPVNKLEALFSYQNDLKSGAKECLPTPSYPMLASLTDAFFNQEITVIFGRPGKGKTTLIRTLCDDFVLTGHKVARLQLEDPIEKHLVTSFAQLAGDGRLAAKDFYRDEANHAYIDEQMKIYESHLELIADSITVGGTRGWDEKEILAWMEKKMQDGVEVVVVDPTSAVMNDKVYLVAHELIWKGHQLLAKYPHSRIIYVNHTDKDGNIGGGSAYEKFCHSAFEVAFVSKTNKGETKEFEVVLEEGEITTMPVKSWIYIKKSREKGGDKAVALEYDSTTLKQKEVGMILNP